MNLSPFSRLASFWCVGIISIAIGEPTQIKLSDWKPTFFFAMALQLTEDVHQLVDGHSPIVVFLVDLAAGSIHVQQPLKMH